MKPTQSGMQSIDEDTDDDGLTDREESEIGTDPNSKDSDNDGINDGYEALLGSNPLNPDSDSDGLSDGEEFYLYLTDLMMIYSDRDGVDDWEEIMNYGTDPNQNHSPVVFFKEQLLETRDWFRIEEFYKFDGDGDYIVDAWDNCNVNYNPDQMDSDNDGVGDRCENSGGSSGGRCYWVYDNDDGTKRYQRVLVDKAECSTIKLRKQGGRANQLHYGTIKTR